MNDIREDFAKQAEEQNRKVMAWEGKIYELYDRANQNLINGVKYADSLIENEKALDKWEISELHTLVGELYYDHDSIKLALYRFRLDESLTFDSPRNKANKAGCYVKKGDLEQALTLLKEAAETNHDFKWYIGNLYEIKKDKEKAISQYEFLYQRDTAIYSYCNERIQELNLTDTELMTELYYKDRRKRTLLLLQGVNASPRATEIRRF